MNDLIFGLSDPFEYAEKLDREYERLLSSTKSKNKRDQIDHALNFSTTAWHLADRVWNCQDAQSILKKRGFINWSAYHDYIFHECPELKVAYDLSIEYKHSDRSEPSEAVNIPRQSRGL